MPGKIACPKCGTLYPWNPALAGKKVRCKCGQSFEATETAAQSSAPAVPAPAAPAAAAPARPPHQPGRVHDPNPPAQTISKAPPQQVVAPPGPSDEPDLYDIADDPPPAPRATTTAMPITPAPLPPQATHAAPPTGLAAPATSARPPATGMSPYPTKMSRPMQEEDTSGHGKKIAAVVVFVIAMIGGIAASMYLLQPTDPLMIPQGGDDAQVINMIDINGATEIREWLGNNPMKRRIVMGQTDQTALALANSLYDMGAVKVVAFGEVMSAHLAMQLPADPAQRQKLIDWANDWNHTTPPMKDVGQNYVLIYMRP